MPAPEDFDAALIAKSESGDNAPPLSISEISSALKRTVEDRFGHVRLRGEISGFKRAASGHVYLALKDEKAVIDGVIWRGNAGRLPFAPEDGLDVIATGKLTTYPGRSKYQIVIDRMELAGEGALMQLFEKLKARLGEEGLFASERKRALPYLPRTIGVVTSPTGSVIRDILHRLADRFPSHVLVWPVLVQGEGAAAQIAQAVNGFSKMAPGGDVPRPDLVIVARGGGSIEDLWSFNEEIVVRAIADCTIPIISAVGHETDTTLADYAADRRAPTPTAAAEMAVPVRADLAGHLTELGLRAQRAEQRALGLASERLERWARQLPKADSLFAPSMQKFDDVTERMSRALGYVHGRAKERFAMQAGRMTPVLLERRWSQSGTALQQTRLTPAFVKRPLADAADRLSALDRLLVQVHPDAPLSRGYAKVTDKEGQVITSSKAATDARNLQLHFGDGKVDALTGGTPISPQKSAKAKKPAPQKPVGEQPKLL
jgi:exodeoxyribonuclease VII large subunit